MLYKIPGKEVTLGAQMTTDHGRRTFDLDHLIAFILFQKLYEWSSQQRQRKISPGQGPAIILSPSMRPGRQRIEWRDLFKKRENEKGRALARAVYERVL